ncbi:MAG TPA: hypothetical protein PLN61_11495 [bacterium]|nr:hypothetical protein [bacterium]HQI49272.1 hypothetical protein [bacterium]HQJ63298.1 hypothetical protein [bacterium]
MRRLFEPWYRRVHAGDYPGRASGGVMMPLEDGEIAGGMDGGVAVGSWWPRMNKEVRRDFMKNANLTQLVYSICDGSYTQEGLIHYIDLAQKISLSYLKYQEMLGKRISGDAWEADLELADLAMDCIAELFGRDDFGRFPQLKKYYEGKFAEMPYINDAEVLILTRRLIVRKTKQELSRIFRERDPEGAKIVRNIKVAIRMAPDLHLFRELGKEFVYHGPLIQGDQNSPADDSLALYLRRSQPPLPEEILHKLFLDNFHSGDSVSVSIRRLLEALHERSEYQNFCALDAVVKLVRYVKFDVCRERIAAGESVNTPLDELESKEMEEYIAVVMDSIWLRLDSQYLRTRKLALDKARIYHRALRDVLYDLIQKRDTSSYYRNLKFYIPELTQKEYRQRERSVFEYLAKLAKKEFRKYLCEML